MICGSCGASNRAGAKFCGGCGIRFEATCAACGSTLEPGARFCSECGTPVGGSGTTPGQVGLTPRSTSPMPSAPGGAAAVGAPPPGAVAERRLVSVLFTDLVGFTTFAEGRDAEDVRETLGRYFELASEVVGRYGGVVEKFIGDAVMAVWGAPTAHEDDAERAVRAGLELVDAVRTLGPDIAARAGVLTGEAAVTIGAANQGMVAGDLVNTASRLQSIAPPGTVVVGETTQRAASRAIAFEPLGEQALKGRSVPVVAWRALRVVAERGGRNRSETLEAPFVGRDEELRLLKELFHATGREGRSRLVSVIGPGGIGKTRLAWELLKYLDGLVETVWLHEGRSPAYGDGIAFWALGEMVRRRAGLREADDAVTTRVRIAAMLAEHIPDPAERRWTEPALLALLGLETGIARDHLFGAWRTLFERLALSGPVILVFEDFHFADSGLIDFVDHLMEWSRSSRIVVVTLARPELLERRPDWGAGKRNFVSVHLDPLPDAAVRELLAGLVPGLPDAAVRSIVARADGIPLYAIETVRMLLADGRLTLDGGVYVPAGDLTRLEVPSTLTALIGSRLDGLPREERSLVQDAAVLGQSFTADALAAVAGIPERELAGPLEALVRREILRVEADPRSPERGQHVFVQALIREVAYNTLARADRKARHLAAARYFERLGSDELAGALAGHYLGARANAQAGPEADALAGQARHALRAAADRAAALGGYDNAVALLEQAMAVTTDPAASGGLLEQAGHWSYAAGRYEAAEAYLRRAIECDRSTGDRPAAARAVAALADALVLAFRSPEAVALLEPAAVEFADLEGDPALVALRNQLGRAYFLTEQQRRAVEVIDEVLEPAARLNLVGIIADALITRGSALAELGRDHEGVVIVEAGLRLAEANGLQRAVERGRNNVGSFQLVRDPAAALATYRRAIDEATRMGTLGSGLRLVFGFADAAMATGDWDDACARLEAVLASDAGREDRAAALSKLIGIMALRGRDTSAAVEEFDRSAGDAEDSLMAMAVDWVRGVVAWTEGRLPEARLRLRDAARRNGQYAPLHFATAATVGLWMGDPDGAEEDIASLDQQRAHGPAIEQRRLALTSGLAALRGRPAESLAGFREATRMGRDHGLAWEEALAGLDAALLLDVADPQVRAIAERTREILQRLGAAPFLALLEERLASGVRGAA